MDKNLKKNAQRVHARRRMRQRFGIELGEVRRRSIVQAIQSGRARFVRRQSCRVTLWRVEVDGVEVAIVYDSKRKEIVTILPEGVKRTPAEGGCAGLQ